MMKRVKKFIKQKLITEDHPFFMWLWEKRSDMAYARRSRMTYAEIEAVTGKAYQELFGRPLNWDNPQTYNEKIHVSKLYMPSPLKTRLADKLAVREWITEKIGSQYLIPLLGVYDSFDEIDFDALPDQFVIKCNHDSGSVTLVKDKSRIDRAYLRRKYAVHMRRNYAWMGFEMHYRDIVPKIIVEQYMGDAINDYKFTCINSKPVFCWTDFDRYTNHRRNVYNMNWELQPFMKDNKLRSTDYECPCPPEFSEMKRIVNTLCEGFAQVRVDLYLIDGRVYFGEMTFSGANGFSPFVPDEWDYTFGALWPFDNTIRKQVLSHSSRP